MADDSVYGSPSMLPDSLVVLSVEGCVLLPRAEVPLNIFEDPYFDIIEEALACRRMIGIVQPRILKPSLRLTDSASTDDNSEAPSTKRKGRTGRNGVIVTQNLQTVGCAGRITAFRETGDGRLIVEICGTCRFKVSVAVRDKEDGLVRVLPDWRPFLTDIGTPNGENAAFDRTILIRALRPFLKAHSVEAEWQQIKDAPAEMLISSLVLGCPFEPAEKQALIEAVTLASRADLLMMLLELARLEGKNSPRAVH